MPKKLTEVDKQSIFVQMEKLHLERDRAVLVLNKGVLVYFTFILLAVLGFMNGALSLYLLNVLVILGLVVLVVAVIPYALQMKSEEVKIQELLEFLRAKR